MSNHSTSIDHDDFDEDDLSLYTPIRLARPAIQRCPPLPNDRAKTNRVADYSTLKSSARSRKAEVHSPNTGSGSSTVKQALANDVFVGIGGNISRVSDARGTKIGSPWIVSFLVHSVVLLLFALIVPVVSTGLEPLAVSFALVEPFEEPLMESVALDIQQPLEDLPGEHVDLGEIEELVEEMPEVKVPDVYVEALDADTLATFSTELDDLAEQIDLASIASSAIIPSDVVPIHPAGMSGLHAGAGSSAGLGTDRIGGQIGERLRAAGAQSGDVQISIAWDNCNDIDLHVQVQTPNGQVVSRIGFFSRRDSFGGMLDVDCNASGPLTRAAVENVFWPKGMAPRGTYTVAIHHYRNNGDPDPTGLEVVTLVDGREQRYTAILRPFERQVVATFAR